MPLTFHSSGQSEMALTFSEDMESPLGERQKLRYSVEVVCVKTGSSQPSEGQVLKDTYVGQQ